MKKTLELFAGKDGFTLLELLMVIIIIGILAALALPQYTAFVEKARAAEALHTIGAIWSAEVIYKLESGDYAFDLSNLSITIPTSDTFWTYSAARVTNGISIIATRTSKKAPPGKEGLTLFGIYHDDTGTVDWDGEYHEVVPPGQRSY